MKYHERDFRIQDNPTLRELSNGLTIARVVRSLTGLLKALGISHKRVAEMHLAAEEVVNQADLLTLPDRFNDAFSDKGWIATSSFSCDMMSRALDLHHAGEEKKAEATILSWFQRDKIDLFAINRAKRFNRALNRWHQLREALDLTFEERYWSATPLILIACDGFASDVLGISPFARDADLTVFDSIAGHPTSLPFLIEKVVARVMKSSDDELILPLRHGIIHGRSLGYANRTVCMKAWLLMIALVDWAYDKEPEQQRRIERQSREGLTTKDLVEQMRKIQSDRRQLDSFEPQEIHGPLASDSSIDSPEFAIDDFLTCWKKSNFGRMAERTLNLSQIPTSKLAGELRHDYVEHAKLIEFEVRVVRHSAVALAEAFVFMRGETIRGDVEGEFRVVASRITEDGSPAMPEDIGKWVVSPYCIYDLMNNRVNEEE